MRRAVGWLLQSRNRPRLDIVGLEEVCDARVTAIDSAGEAQTELFLVKLTPMSVLWTISVELSVRRAICPLKRHGKA